MSDDEVDSDMEENNVPPAGVNEEFCRCIQVPKWSLYQAIVLGPKESTPEAQHNSLLQTYLNHLERLRVVMENALKGRIVDAELKPFPSRLRHEILICSQGVRRMTKNLSPTDIIPYRDYIFNTLHVFPYVHPMKMVGGADDVEAF